MMAQAMKTLERALSNDPVFHNKNCSYRKISIILHVKPVDVLI